MSWNLKIRFFAAGALSAAVWLAASLLVAQTSWTTPRTWADDDILTAAELNVDIRDNSTHLKEAIDGLNSTIDARIASWARVNSPTGTIPLDSLPIWSGTQSEYDALGTYDDDYLYLILE